LSEGEDNLFKHAIRLILLSAINIIEFIQMLSFLNIFEPTKCKLSMLSKLFPA